MIKYPDKNNYFGSQFKGAVYWDGEIMMAGVREGAGHVSSSLKKQRDMNTYAQVSPFNAVQDPNPPQCHHI